MQHAIISHRGQAKPWTSIPRINWGHELTRGLAAYVYDMGNGSAIELVSGDSSNTLITKGTPTNPVMTTTYLGQNWKYTQQASASVTAHFEFVRTSRLDNNGRQAGASAATGVILQTTTPAGTGGAFFATGDTTGATDVALGCNASRNAQVSFNNSTYVADAGVLPVGAFSTIAQTCPGPAGSTGGIMYSVYPGAFNRTVKTVSFNAGNTNQVPILGDQNAGAAGTNYFSAPASQIFYGAVWNGRLLSDADVRKLNDDPWCFLIWPEDDIFATLTTSVVTGTLRQFSSIGRQAQIIGAD